jgi:predicted dehydrogenase
MKWFKHGDAGWTISDIPEITNHGQRIAGLAGPLADFLHGTRPSIATAEEGRDVLRMIQACYASHEQGRRIAL